MAPKPDPRPALVLVADDDDDIRTLVRVLIADAGLDVVEAIDGDAALAVLETISPDVAILDVEMPGTGGYEVLAALRANAAHADMSVLFLTARGDPHHVIEGLELGANDYITKPFHGPELVARVQAALRAKTGIDSLRNSNTVLQDLACRDGLTGIHNRRHLDEQIVALGSASSRHHRSFGALMIDIDGFKLIDDSYGHLAGDQVLCQVAQFLAARARAEDVVGRYGGDEFLFLLPETDLEGAFGLGDRTRRAVESTAFTADAGDALDITISVGCASQIGGDPYALIASADRALYEAKAAGRNACVRAAPALTEERTGNTAG